MGLLEINFEWRIARLVAKIGPIKRKPNSEELHVPGTEKQTTAIQERINQ